LKHFTLHQLQVFEAIARAGSFTRAAEELCLTQPTVSQQMKQLTSSVGIPLQLHWYVLYPSGKQLSVVARTFLEYLLDDGKRLAAQVDLALSSRE